jgi:hypothetical protein
VPVDKLQEQTTGLEYAVLGGLRMQFAFRAGGKTFPQSVRAFLRDRVFLDIQGYQTYRRQW